MIGGSRGSWRTIPRIPPDRSPALPPALHEDGPIRPLSDDAFDALLHDAMASLPERFRELLDVVPVIVEDFPGAAVQEEFEHPEELMGLFVGPPIEEWNRSDAAPETAVIYIYQRPLEASCMSRRELAEQIRITLFHELGHCLGFDEDGLTRIGLE